MEILDDPAIPFLGTYPEETKAASFTIAERQKQPKRVLTNEQKYNI